MKSFFALVCLLVVVTVSHAVPSGWGGYGHGAPISVYRPVLSGSLVGGWGRGWGGYGLARGWGGHGLSSGWGSWGGRGWGGRGYGWGGHRWGGHSGGWH